MNTLILDCSNGMSIYVLKDEKEYSIKSETKNKHTDELLLEVERLLLEAGLKVSDLNNLCVLVGPGSFTGIRVAVSVTKGLAIGTGAKVFACSNFDVYNFDAKEKAVYLLDAFSDYVYVREFDGKNVSDSCEHFDEVATRIKEGFAVYTESEKLQNLLKNNEIDCKIPKNQTVATFKSKIENGESVEILEIKPIYLRASQAEIEREKKLKGENK